MSVKAAAGSWVTTSGGARVARLAKDLKLGVKFAEDLFCDWQIEPIRNGERAGAFLGTDGRPWAAKLPDSRSGRGYVGRIHIEGMGWV